MYNLLSGKYIEQLNTVDNLFIRRLYRMSKHMAIKGKMLTIVCSNNSKLNSDNNVMINVCSLSPLVDDSLSNIVEDIAKFRWEMLDFGDKDYWRKKKDLLFLDYILSSCVCYVEIMDKGVDKGSGKVDKFFATRNRFLAGRMAGMEDSDTSKYTSYLSPVELDYQMDSLRVLKISPSKNKYKITQPRTALNFARNIKVTPLFFINSYVGELSASLEDNMYKFRYLKDNGQIRELCTTFSESLISEYYDEEYAEKVLKIRGEKKDRGYMRVPELGCSKYDVSGVRALNICRIQSCERISTIDTTYIDVDFSNIIPFFYATVEGLREKSAMAVLYDYFLGVNAKDCNFYEMKSKVLSEVESRFIIGTSTFQKEVHNLMIKYPMIFKGYTGKPSTYSVNSGKADSFNLGLE